MRWQRHKLLRRCRRLSAIPFVGVTDVQIAVRLRGKSASRSVVLSGQNQDRPWTMRRNESRPHHPAAAVSVVIPGVPSDSSGTFCQISPVPATPVVGLRGLLVYAPFLLYTTAPHACPLCPRPAPVMTDSARHGAFPPLPPARSPHIGGARTGFWFTCFYAKKRVAMMLLRIEDTRPGALDGSGRSRPFATGMRWLDLDL